LQVQQLRDEGPDALREVANLSCNVTTPNVEINLTTPCNEKLYIKKGVPSAKAPTQGGKQLLK